MRFTKPAWVVHQDALRYEQTSKRLSLFSVHVHPDGSRVATGGLDAKIRIWSTKPILDAQAEQSGRPPKSLSTLSMHTGPVLTVRWAHNGKWLASGSDDEIVMIWDLDPAGAGRVWGSDDVNVEGWKPLKRLPGHESDVTDLAWAPEDRYLASVGLDSKVMIWCGFTLERLHKLDQHQGFVKGVCWDPVGEFLATGSDDRSVKIWRTTDWGLETEITKPFEHSPGSTFFRRLSWSPDGAHITASNATNNKGYVFIAAVINRNTWTSDISLVGHENTIEVTAYNPHIFLRDASKPIATHNICSVVALGADDRSISVWQTKSARPLIVAKEVFERQIMDLCWSRNGLVLYAVSSDGSLAVLQFDPEELEGLASESAQKTYLQKFSFVPPPIPSGYSHHNEDDSFAQRGRTTPPPSPRASLAPRVATPNGSIGEQVNILVAKRGPKKDKRRIQPTFMNGSNSIPSAANGNGMPNGFSQPSGHSRFDTITLPMPPFSQPIRQASSSSSNFDNHSGSYSAHARQPSRMHNSVFGGDDPMDGGGFNAGMDLDDFSGVVQISSLDASDGSKGKRVEVLSVKPRTLGGDRAREALTVRDLSVAGPGPSSLASSLETPMLNVPGLKNLVSVKAEGSDDVFEGRNSEDGNPSELLYVSGKQTQWLDYLPSHVLAIAATSAFCAAAMADGSLNVYSITGRRLMPTLSLGSPCALLEGSKNSLMALTATGHLHVWNVKKQQALFPPTPIHSILSANAQIHSASIRANGAPVILLSTGIAYTYDPALYAWVKLSDRWWTEGSDVWSARQRSSVAQGAQAMGIVASIESNVSKLSVAPPDNADKPRPQWWGQAMTLGHLESRLHSARMLDSGAEYKQALVLYAKRLADEGFRSKAEELIRELFGPLYWRPGRDDSWSPTVVGMVKRDLLKDVLTVFARSKTLAKLGQDWQETLKKAAMEE